MIPYGMRVPVAVRRVPNCYILRLPLPLPSLVLHYNTDRPLLRCQPFTTTTFAKRAFRSSAPVVWNSLPKTVLRSDFVVVFRSRLKTFLFSQAFSFSLCSLTRCLAPAPLKLRLYGAIQMCLLLLLLLLLL